ncbi:MAG: 4Fe-4S dicluster domain-containing protein [Deltaproteobacteria bacterium]|nr:4Fe-4S dicluster domain-containing protein [Deltaproteobacteria bacterium]
MPADSRAQSPEAQTPRADSRTLASRVADATHQNAFLCYQCQRCSSGCPMAQHLDLLPSEVMRAIQEGDESVAASRTVWLCASCQTCNTRCPQGLDIPGIIDHFRQQTLEQASVPEQGRFFKAFLRNIRLFGRAYEAGLMAELNLRDGKPLRDVDLGIAMLRKGKLKLFPHFARTPGRVNRVGTATNRVAYYPGCSLQSAGQAYDRSFRGVARALGIELCEIPGWTCCGATPAHGSDPITAMVLPLKNLSTVEKMGLDRAVAPCAACYSRLRSSVRHHREQGDLADRVDEVLGRDYQDSVKVLNVLDCLAEAGPQVVAERVQKPLSGLKVACYYGCLLTRPPADTGSLEPENPAGMDRIVRELGAEPLEWTRKTDCCGGSLAITQTPIAKRLTAEILKEARARGADLIATACPLCQLNLDERQPEMAGDLGFTIPAVYVTQLMAVALGLPEADQALTQAAVAPTPLFHE